MKYTKGKWIPVELTSDFREAEIAIKSEKGLWIATVHQDRDTNGACISEAEMRANVRLIAAAPDLLAALKIALPYVESFDGDNADRQTKANAATVRAAIARATGSEATNG